MPRWRRWGRGRLHKYTENWNRWARSFTCPSPRRLSGRHPYPSWHRNSFLLQTAGNNDLSHTHTLITRHIEIKRASLRSPFLYLCSSALPSSTTHNHFHIRLYKNNAVDIASLNLLHTAVAVLWIVRLLMFCLNWLSPWKCYYITLKHYEIFPFILFQTYSS